MTGASFGPPDHTLVHGRAFLSGGGEMGARMRAHDWSLTPLGPPEAWPQPLKTVTSLMLAANQAMFVAWGPERAMLYNDAYAQILGNKHPAALACPFFEVWSELVDSVGPIMDRGYAGEPTCMDDLQLLMMRKGYLEEAHFSFFYAPVRDADDAQSPGGQVSGVYSACVEITEKVFADRRAAFRGALDECLRGLADPHEVMTTASAMLGEHLGAGQVIYADVDDAGVFATIEREWNDGTMPRNVGRHRMEDFGPEFIAALTHGETVVIEDVRHDPRTDTPSAVASFAQTGIGAFMSLPLIKGRRLVALMSVHNRLPRRWSAADVAFAGEVAERTWQSVERARAEAALRRNEERLRALLNATSYVLYRMNPDWTELRQLDGQGFLTDTQSPSTTWLAEYIHPDDQLRVWEVIREAISTKGIFELEHRVRRVDGTLGWTLSRAVPILGPHGEIEEWFGAASDVTDRKTVETALRESEERFRLMADAVPQIVWITDAEGRVEFFNKQWSDYTGIVHNPTTAAETADNFIHPDDVALTMERFEEARRTGGTYLVEHRIRSKDGNYRWFLVRGEPYRDPHSGAIVRWFGASTDIHDRTKAEVVLRTAHDMAEKARQVAEDANRSKSRFLAAASHDLRQPMQSLLLFLDVLKPHVAPRGQDALKHLGRGLDVLRDLLNSLLDVSHLDAGIVRPAIEDFDVGQMIEQIGSAYAPIAAAKGLDLRVTQCEAAVRSDPTLLARMVRNLVENALRYTDRGRVTIACHKTEDTLRIEVADTGIGIPDEHLKRIWEEFHQVGNPERDRNRGLGLGLAIVQRLSALLEHPVEVRSTPGQGSVFSIAMPLGRVGPKQAVVAPVEVVGNGRVAVLVDDDAIVLLGLKATFEAWGYKVLAATSTEGVLAALRKDGRRPDIVVADYRLREGQIGTEAILRVREAYGADIPGIILTGETGSEAEHDATAHSLHVIYKPVTPRQLGEALDRLLTGNAESAPATAPPSQKPF
ncbi:PAS domain-containing protein [Azospirillum sp. YIM B02556]|uniref:histidine kinase n=1 Tax=Azospirillum endophyticum TaxID=2800326 RepID=A0ABS1F7S0_9PROT|nr:PAS domain-containing protein [Azospirillum endophyticum]MBK1839480.1 PAS domain-containing protein [Azospirillum endophyticum]